MTSERVRFFPPIALSFLAGGQVSFGIRLIPGTGLVSPVLLCYARVATEREAEMANVLSHNERAAATWGAGGRDYDRISEFVSDALTHLVNRIIPQPGERFLDVGTGTGWIARLLSSRGTERPGAFVGGGWNRKGMLRLGVMYNEVLFRCVDFMGPISFRFGGFYCGRKSLNEPLVLSLMLQFGGRERF